ncbi:nucleoside-diphosphate sugar epimerase [Pelagivirga sediminicola]|uniref:Nucleoside-diphosphate sugar epimerase n=1 Tax=Pelagivirga sediminicola TaxID=2170575 RepID=A0A2T7G9J8_9RHOB|nr:nucleoside-diphosphate sugar epimerase/dehydratase [Pelagivirga sediminicola]PVA11094.1 nucleoside-diphosphate sugar epimerase [Pelagivirga sediminicola]
MINGGLTHLLQLKRAHKRALQLFADAVVLLLSYLLATLLAGGDVASFALPGFWLSILIFVPVSLLIFVRLGFYRAVVRYLSIPLLMTILTGVLASASVLLAAVNMMQVPLPWTVAPIYGLTAMCVLGGLRITMRALLHRHPIEGRTAVIIYGAGKSGRQLLGSLREQSEFIPVAFVDDAAELRDSDVGGLRVYDPARLGRLIQIHGIKVVLLAVPSASRAERREIVERLEKLPVRVQTIPGMTDIVTGRARVSDLHDVAIEDLLGRDPVPGLEPLMKGNIQGKVVMVTGAGGSIGSELCRQIIQQEPQTLVLWELSELALYTLNNELGEIAEAQRLDVRLVPLMGSVQNPRRMASALERFGVQTIYHAAAYKHVPLVEQNVVEGLRNNVFGTKVVADAAIAAGVESVILVSSDKAVRPTNMMGASKRLAELVCQAAALRQSATVFSMVRFGNVLGSSGSVIPRFRQQVERGGPVTVTHPSITRYFMTIPEAAQLVIQAGALATGGDVFVLDMGEPIKIVDLADRIIRLSGLTSYRLAPGAPHRGPAAPKDKSAGDIAICFTGLRPGEKLYEELLIGEDSLPTRHPRIMTASEIHIAPDALDELLDEILASCLMQDIAALRRMISAAPIGYRPSGPTADLLGAETMPRPRLARTAAE